MNKAFVYMPACLPAAGWFVVIALTSEKKKKSICVSVAIALTREKKKNEHLCTCLPQAGPWQ